MRTLVAGCAVGIIIVIAAFALHHEATRARPEPKFAFGALVQHVDTGDLGRVTHRYWHSRWAPYSNRLSRFGPGWVYHVSSGFNRSSYVHELELCTPPQKESCHAPAPPT